MKLQKTSILNQSGWQTAWRGYIRVLKKENYYVVKGVSRFALSTINTL